MSGLLALPVWPWGPVAAHNGALLVGFVRWTQTTWWSGGSYRPTHAGCGGLTIGARATWELLEWTTDGRIRASGWGYAGQRGAHDGS